MTEEARQSTGKLTARDHIDLLFDEDSFHETTQSRRPPAANAHVITGRGTVRGRSVFAYTNDFRRGIGQPDAARIQQLMDRAIVAGAPLVCIHDGTGARVQEGPTTLAGYGGIFRRNAKASGVIPQISVLLGPSAGAAAYALADFVFVVRGIAAPSGVAQFGYEDEWTCIAELRYLLSLLPVDDRVPAPNSGPLDPPDRRTEHLLALDTWGVVEQIVDDGDYLEIRGGCALARLGGRTVGVVVDRPNGWSDDRAARFIRFCETFQIPLVTLVDDRTTTAPGVSVALCRRTGEVVVSDRAGGASVVDPATTRSVLIRCLHS